MKTLLQKEFAQNWRSFRFPALLLVFLFFALLDPITNRYMNEIFAMFADFEMALPEPTAEGALFAFTNSISQIGLVVMIFVIMGLVAKEKETGVTAWVLSKPVGRWNYLLAKIINVYALLILGLTVSFAIAYLYTWSLIGRVNLSDALWALISLIVFTLFVATLTFFFSTVAKSPLQAGGLTILIFLLSGMANILINSTSFARFYPNTLLTEIAGVLHGTSGPAEIVVPAAVTLGLSLLLIYLAGFRFAKMEL